MGESKREKDKKEEKRIFNYYKLGDNFAIKWVFSWDCVAIANTAYILENQN